MTRLHRVARDFIAEMSFNDRGSTFSLRTGAGPRVQGVFDSNARRHRVNTALRSNWPLAAESSYEDHKGKGG